MSGSQGPGTPRRSRRWQPLATPLIQSTDSKIEANWEGAPVYTRTCNPDVDLMQEERDEREETFNGAEGHDEQTVFYAAFSLKKPNSKQQRAKGRILSDDITTYKVGDTITVETDTLSRQRRPPSVAVIVSMWEVRRKNEVHALAPHAQISRMRIRVHWFLRPSELAAIRQKREHAPNEIYYSLSSSDILVPNVIVSPCSISSDKSCVAKEKVKWTYEPVIAKGRASPKKGIKGLRSTHLDEQDNSSSEDEDAGELPTATTGGCDKFCSFYAINSQRGIFYRFRWEDKHRSGFASARQIPECEDEVDGWALGLDWNVDTTEDVVQETKGNSSRDRGAKVETKKKGPPAKKRVKIEADREDDQEDDDEDVDSGSEAAFSNDEEDDDHEFDEAASSEDDGGGTEDDTNPFEPSTPSRKRKRGQAAPKTPRKSGRGNLAHPTPHSKAALRKRKSLRAAGGGSPRKRKATTFAIRPPTLEFKTDMSKLPKDPWLRAMHVLHVGNRPEALPCRTVEYEKVLASVGELLDEGSGGCVYISGQPGTGKTATVHTVVRELKRMAEENEINPFTYVEINGLRISEPSAAYTVLCDAISRATNDDKESKTRMSAKESLKALSNHFSGRTRRPGDHAYVVLMDELDQLVTPKQDVIYNFFNWPTLVGSKLVVIAVANTMDLPERVMTGRVRSRLGMKRINFEPYNQQQLIEIVNSRLTAAKEGLDEDNAKTDVMAKDAIKLAAARVSSITGDARRMLDVCRRVVELVSTSHAVAMPKHVNTITSAMQNNPTAAYLRDCSLHERIMLASLIRCVRRQGVETASWADVIYQHENYVGALTNADESSRKPSAAELTAVLDSLVASRAVLLEDGPTMARKPAGERRLLLNVQQIEVERVLSDVGGQVWKNALNA